MDWLWGAGLLALVACRAMCIGGMALAAVGLRRAGSSDATSDDRQGETNDHDHVTPSR